MSQYKTGTVSVTKNSATVTGLGTLWLANLDAGNLFTKEGDNVAYTIASVDSDTVIQLNAPYAGSTSSGSNYGVTIDFTPNGLPLLSPQDLNTAAIYNEAIKNIDNSGSMTLGTAAQADIVGTVSESGGVPTGAIIETGTNANGTYTKYADGTMICRKKSQSVTSSATGIISEFSEVWPVAFIDATYVVSFMQATAHGDPLASSAVIGQSISGRDLQFCFFAGHSMFQSAIPYQFDLTAIGRWF